MRVALAVSLATLLAGAALIAFSVVTAGTAVELVVVFPVLSGSSVSFLVGVVLLIAGFFSLPFGLAGEWEAADSLPPAAGTVPPDRPSGVGGFVLVGPVPIVFGSWRGVSRRTRWLLALAGAVLLTAAIVALLWLAG